MKVHRDGRVDVRAPRHVTKTMVRQFVLRRADWILDKQSYFQDLLKKNPAKEFRTGETFSVFGRNFRLRLERQPGLEFPFCKTEGQRLKVVVNGQVGEGLKNAIRGTIRDWYGVLTEKKARAVVRKHAKGLAVTPGRLIVTEQAKRWASCSKIGNIRLNWRLSMMPPAVFEYVVVHELCHLKTHNHSLKFWRILKSVLPDYETRREWLRKNGPGLMFNDF
ncbi:MAG: M48 family metallopeptidase [Elusimicrobia bacterium]|nr:M48 family metallopeptidase [Elusimicrobiota bacterium]